MARLFSSGFEAQRLASTAALSGEGGTTTGSPTIDTETPRSGAACAACAPSANNNVGAAPATALDRAYFFRTAIRMSGGPPSANLPIQQVTSGAGTCFQVFCQTTGKLTVFANLAAATIVTTEFTPEAGAWYLIESKLKVPTAGKGFYKLIIRSDAGVVVYESAEIEATFGNSTITGFATGHLSATDTKVTVKIDDIAINDDQGASEAGFPGNGKIVVLKPTSDKARAGFTGGAGATTNLYKAVRNTPPKGEASPGGDETELGSANSNATDFYEANLAPYSTAVSEGGGGIKAADVIKLVQAFARSGNSSVTSREGGVEGVSNPALAEVKRATGTTAAASDTATPPVGWGSARTAVAYAPVVERGVSPVVKFRKATASTDRLLVDQMGLLVEYQPMTEVPLQAAGGVGSATIGLQAQTTIPLNASSGVATTSASVQAATSLSLESSGGSSATLSVRAATSVPLNASSGTSTTSMTVTAPTAVPLGASTGTATDEIALSADVRLDLGPSTGRATDSLSVLAQPVLALGPASGVATATLNLRTPILPGYFVRRSGAWIPV